MPGYFFDTSAPAKVSKELGSDLIDKIVTEPGSHRFISRFTILEMESVLALKFRTGDIDEQSLFDRSATFRRGSGEAGGSW